MSVAGAPATGTAWVSGMASVAARNDDDVPTYTRTHYERSNREWVR
jgi:hypothetical protein